jgi:hypothetical protein
MLTRMNTCLRNLFSYFENVLHPAEGSLENSNSGKTKKKSKMGNTPRYTSPESVNIRGGIIKKQDKVKRNPAP